MQCKNRSDSVQLSVERYNESTAFPDWRVFGFLRSQICIEHTLSMRIRCSTTGSDYSWAIRRKPAGDIEIAIPFSYTKKVNLTYAGSRPVFCTSFPQ